MLSLDRVIVIGCALLLGLGLAACGGPQTLPGGPPPGVLPPSPTPSLTPPQPPTLTPRPSDTPTPRPSRTPAPTATLPPTPTLLFLPQTPLPLGAPPIALETAAQVSGLAEWYEPDVMGLVWTPEANTLAVATSSLIHWYNVPEQSLIRTLYPALEGVTKVTFDGRNAWFVVGTRRGSEQDGFISGLELWQGPNWQPRGILYGTGRPLTGLAFSPDDEYLAVAYTGPRGQPGEVDLWNVVTWSISTTLATGQALEVAFSPDASLLAVSPDRYSLRVYNLIERKWLYRMPTSFTGSINVMAFSPDGFTLATGHYDGMVRLWDLRDGHLLLEFPTQAVVQSLTFSPDGRIVATGSSYENTLVRLWSAGSGVLLRSLEGHTKGVTHLAFASNSQYLASASYDGMVRIWGMPPAP